MTTNSNGIVYIDHVDTNFDGNTDKILVICETTEGRSIKGSFKYSAGNYASVLEAARLACVMVKGWVQFEGMKYEPEKGKGYFYKWTVDQILEREA